MSCTCMYTRITYKYVRTCDVCDVRMRCGVCVRRTINICAGIFRDLHISIIALLILYRCPVEN